MEDPLCNSSFGSMVSLDYVTPDTEIESLEWLYALEHDDETMTSLTDALVWLLLESGSGVSVCSPDFAPHVKTLTESSVRALSNRSGDQELGQEDCELRH